MSEKGRPGIRVFVSYRRESDAFLPGRLTDELAHHFGEANVFFDVDSIPPGSDFRTVIRERLDDVDAVLVLIGSAWDSGRLAQPNDVVRTELHETLRRQKLLIPVLVGDTKMPPPDGFPPELEAIAYLNATRVRPDPDFDTDAERLITAIESGVMARQHAAVATHDRAGVGRGTEITKPRANVKGRVIAAAAALLILVLIVGGLLLRDGGGSTTEVEVSGTQPWTDSGIDLRDGEHVDITATGTVFHNPLQSTGPEGIPNTPDLLTPLASANHAGLLARVTDRGEMFYVGKDKSFTASRSGRLFLGINDGGLENNSGAFDATITVSDDSR